MAVKRRTLLVAAGKALVAAAAPYAQIRPAQSQVVAERPKYPPAAVRTLLVPENYATLQLAYAACKPGDHISLAGGTYAGSFTFDRNLGSKPVVIRSRSLNGAVFTGQLTVSGTGHRFHEIKTTFQGNDTTASSAAIRVFGSYFWLTRSWVTSRHGIWTGKKASHVFVSWNRFTGKSNIGTACSNIYLDSPAASH